MSQSPKPTNKLLTSTSISSSPLSDDEIERISQEWSKCQTRLNEYTTKEEMVDIYAEGMRTGLSLRKEIDSCIIIRSHFETPLEAFGGMSAIEYGTIYGWEYVWSTFARMGHLSEETAKAEGVAEGWRQAIQYAANNYYFDSDTAAALLTQEAKRRGIKL